MSESRKLVTDVVEHRPGGILGDILPVLPVFSQVCLPSYTLCTTTSSYVSFVKSKEIRRLELGSDLMFVGEQETDQ